MNTRRFIGVLSLLAAAVCAVGATAAQAETRTLYSGSSTSLCIDPAAFSPGSYGPLYEPNVGPFPDTGAACGVSTPSQAVPVTVEIPGLPGRPGGPGKGAGAWNGKISGASWVSLNNSGQDSTNLPPAYYIYDATFCLGEESLEGSSINVHVFADNVAGAFLNGTPIGNQPYGSANIGFKNFDQGGSYGPIGGWSFSSSAGFTNGLNTVQFVVLDESQGYTGIDFSAAVTTNAHFCASPPHWYSDGKPIKPGEVEPVGTAGTLKIKLAKSVLTCKLKDQESIKNPLGVEGAEGGAGTDKMTEFTLSGCTGKPSPCPVGSTLEVVPSGLPWHSHLSGNTPVTDVIENMGLEVECSGTTIETFGGELAPTVGTSKLEFGPGSGALTGPGGTAVLSGNDVLTGPAGDTRITAGP